MATSPGVSAAHLHMACQDASRFTVVCGILRKGRTRNCYQPEAPFDMLVSEILGTLATSESMFEHTLAALPHLTRFPNAPGGVYAVPQRIEQYLAVYNLGQGLYSSSSAPEAIQQGIRAVLPVPDSSGDVPLTPTNDTGLTLPVHLLEPEVISERVAVRTEVYKLDEQGTSWQKKQVGTCELGFLPGKEQPLTSEHFIITEWEATLCDGVVLRNTVSELAAMSARNACARHAQWGFMLCCLHEHGRAAPVVGSVKVRVGPWTKGIPYLRVQPLPPRSQVKP